MNNHTNKDFEYLENVACASIHSGLVNGLTNSWKDDAQTWHVIDGIRRALYFLDGMSGRYLDESACRMIMADACEKDIHVTLDENSKKKVKRMIEIVNQIADQINDQEIIPSEAKRVENGDYQ